jgi:hypothetical protein
MEMSNLTIYQAMAAILADVDHIGKDRQADMGGAGKYKFRGIDDIYNALHKSFAKYGVFIIPRIVNSELEIQEKEKTYNGVTTKTYSQSAKLTIEFIFASADGSSITAVGFGYALDSSDKAATKAQSAALKYCLMQTFLIPTEESKDIEDSNIEIAHPAVKKVVAPLSKPVGLTPAVSTQSPDLVSQYQSDLKKAFEILDWEPTKKAGWAKTINPQPFSAWSDRDWQNALTKAYLEIDKANETANGVK